VGQEAGTGGRVPPRLDRFEKTNEMLLNFNNLSSARLQQMNERFLHHTRTLVEMKRDLDSIFRRIRWASKPRHQSHQTMPLVQQCPPLSHARDRPRPHQAGHAPSPNHPIRQQATPRLATPTLAMPHRQATPTRPNHLSTRRPRPS
jgi:hypothetical protein